MEKTNKPSIFRRIYNSIKKFVLGTEQTDLTYKQLIGIAAVRLGRLVVYPIYNGIVRPVKFVYGKVRSLFAKKPVLVAAPATN